MKERQKELGIKGLSPEEVAADSSLILEWLKGTGASKVVIHLDIDVIDPADMIAGVGIEPNGMKQFTGKTFYFHRGENLFSL